MQQVVLFLTSDDFANCGFEFMMSLREVGIVSEGLKYVPHGFNYINQLRVKEHTAEVVGAVNSASHIVYCQSTALCRDAVAKNPRGKKFFAFFGDQGYRNNWTKILKRYGKLDKVFYQGSDLKGKSPYPEAWLLPAIDTEFIQTKQDVSQMSHNSPIKIAHFPRSPKAKGTKSINKVMDKLMQDPSVKDKFIYNYQDNWKCDWVENLERLDTCDIYIESQAYTIGEGGSEEVPLGEFGVTAMEASSLSKIVVTCFNSFEDYKQEFGCVSEIVPSGSEEELEKQLRYLLSLPIEKLIDKRKATREWLKLNHGRKATGQRLVSLLDLRS